MLDSAVISEALAVGAEGVRLIGRAIPPEEVCEEYREAFKFVVGYHRELGQVPGIEIVAAKYGLEFPAPGKADLNFLVEQVMHRTVHGILHEGMLEVHQDLKRMDPMAALVTYMEIAERAKARATRRQVARPLGEAIAEADAYVKRIMSGERGVPMPWPSLDNATFGLWPEDLVVVAARLGVGKTWLAVLFAYYAWMKGYRVLFGTTEISQMAVGLRFLALHGTFSYLKLRKGMFANANKIEEFNETVAKLLEAQGFYLVGGNFDSDPATYEAALEHSKAQFGIIDGAYLLHLEGKKYLRAQHERAAEVFNELKRIAKRNKIPLLATTQLNRNAKNSSPSSIEAENISSTDVAGWNADIALGMYQTDDQRAQYKMGIKGMKFREAPPLDLVVHWDLEQMFFEESQEYEEGGGGDADESGLPADALGTPQYNFGEDPPF